MTAFIQANHTRPHRAFKSILWKNHCPPITAVKAVDTTKPCRFLWIPIYPGNPAGLQGGWDFVPCPWKGIFENVLEAFGLERSQGCCYTSNNIEDSPQNKELPSPTVDSAKVEKVKVRVAQSCQTLCNPMDCIVQNTGVGSLCLLQGIFPTQGSNPGLSHCRQILSQLGHKGGPRILEWVAYPFSRGSSWPRNRTRVSCTAGRFFTNWAIREAQGWEVLKVE